MIIIIGVFSIDKQQLLQKQTKLGRFGASLRDLGLESQNLFKWVVKANLVCVTNFIYFLILLGVLQFFASKEMSCQLIVPFINIFQVITVV